MYKLIQNVEQAAAHGLGDSAVGAVVDPSFNIIVGFRSTHHFDADDSRKLAPYIHKYRLVVPVRGINDDATVTVYVCGSDLTAALMALGVGSNYEANYGDYAEVIAQLHNPKAIAQTVVARAREDYLTLDELKAALKDARCE